MEDFRYGNLIIAHSPHIEDRITTAKIMLHVIIALLPALIVATYVFGYNVIIMTLVCVVFCVFFEFAFQRITKRPDTIDDLSAVVTGILLSLNLPVTLPYWQAIIGCFVAIVVAKQIFGGIGSNFVNPAILGRVVLLVSFPQTMTNWVLPNQGFSTLDATSGPTPLGEFTKGNLEALPSNLDLFLGFVGGSLGETGALFLLLGGIFLVARKIITPETPIAFLGTMVIVSLIAGVDPIFQILAGGAMLGAFFMATDYSSSPLTFKGKIVFGIGCGLFTMLIRLLGAYPEGVSFAILFMNILTPHINRFAGTRLYGGGKNA
jgi:electron transport complex protein RnfD